MKTCKLLIAEDNRALCDLWEQSFSFCPDIDVCGVVHNGKRALEEIENQQPDLLLLDLIMPVLDGISVLKNLQTCPPAKHLRILVMSAVDETTVIDKAMEIGADYFVIKPMDFEELLYRVRMLMGSSKPASAIPVERQIAIMLQSMEISPSLFGYTYISEAVARILQVGSVVPLTKDIYADIAARHQTNVDCVEGAIRKTIHRAAQINTEAYRLLVNTYGNGQKLTNAKFLMAIAEQVKFGMVSESESEIPQDTPLTSEAHSQE